MNVAMVGLQIVTLHSHASAETLLTSELEPTVYPRTGAPMPRARQRLAHNSKPSRRTRIRMIR